MNPEGPESIAKKINDQGYANGDQLGNRRMNRKQFDQYDHSCQVYTERENTDKKKFEKLFVYTGIPSLECPELVENITVDDSGTEAGARGDEMVESGETVKSIENPIVDGGVQDTDHRKLDELRNHDGLEKKKSKH